MDPLKASKARWPWFVVIGIFCFGIAVMCSGCAAPPELAEVERASIASLKNYHENAERTVTSLLEAYEKSNRQTLDALFELDLRDSTQKITAIESLPEPGEDGKIDPGEIKTVDFQAVDPATVVALLKSYRDRLDNIEEETAKFRGKWRAANQDYSNAVELREQVYRWLTRPAVGPEEIDAVGRALADEIRKAD